MNLASHTGRAPEAAIFHRACRRIIETHKITSAASLSWAVNYARAGLTLSTQEAIKVQALYILANIRGWRGKEATEVRTTLKGITGDLK